MQSFAFIAAALVVIGAPALAAISWHRSRGAPSDSVELVAIGYSGMAVSAIVLWIAGQLGGFGWRVVLLSGAVGTVLLAAPAVVRLVLRLRTADSDQGMTGHHDGRMIPDAIVDRSGPTYRFEAPASHTHFALLAVAGSLFALLVYLPFVNFGWLRPDGVHRMAMTDWYKHLATASTLAASDTFPPANPFLHVDVPAPYYYGYHLVAAGVAKLAGAVAVPEAAGNLVYPALLGLTLMTAFATPFVAYTAAKTIASGRGDTLGDTASVPLMAALGATFLAGFDLLPLALDTAVNLARGAASSGGMAALRAAVPSTHLDYWVHHNERQFNAPYLTTAWAPQHMAAVLVALVVVHLVIRRRLAAERRADEGSMGAGWLLPALLLASLPAISAYVAFGLAIGVVGAITTESVRHRCPVWQTSGWQMWLSPGFAAALMAMPVVAVITSGSASGLTIAVSDAGTWVNGAVFSSLFGANWATGIFDTPAVYFLEFGVLGVLAVLEIQRQSSRGRLQPHQQHVVAALCTVLLLVVFIRPPVGEPNNLYARPLVLVWFLLAPFAAMRLARLVGAVTRTGGAADSDRPASSRAHRRAARGNRRWALAAVLFCLLANGYALLGLMLEGAMFWATPVTTVEVARWVNDNTAPGDVVAVAPEEFASAFGYFLRRPMAVADERHARLFGAGEDEFERVSSALQAAREAGDAPSAAAGVDAAAGDVLLVAISGGAPAWVDSPCFEPLFRNAAWVAVRRTSACR